MSFENENNGSNEGQANFGLPEGYFQRSAISLANKIEWEEEHKNFPTLVELRNKHVFTIPENYFQILEDKLELIEYSKLFSIVKRNDFTVPGNYFEEREFLELAGLETLASLKKQNSFVVDENYFADNEARIQNLLKEEKSSRIFNLFRVKLSYAVAALLVVVLGTWTYNYYFKTIEVQDCGTMACLDKTDLVKSKNLENMDDDELYELVDAKSLEEKINKNKTELPSKTKTDSSLKNEISDELLDEL